MPTGYSRDDTIPTSIREERPPRSSGRSRKRTRFSPTPKRENSTTANEKPRRPSPPPLTAPTRRIGNNRRPLPKVLVFPLANRLKAVRTHVNRQPLPLHVKNRNRSQSRNRRSFERRSNHPPHEYQGFEKPLKRRSRAQRTSSPNLPHPSHTAQLSHQSP